jgi:hypothetical protein
LLVLAIVLPNQAPPTLHAASNQDTEFWLVFAEQMHRSNTITRTLFITGDTTTSGTVEVPGLDTPFREDFTVTPGTITEVVVPEAAEVIGTGTFDKGIHVTANDPVTVYGLNREYQTTDAYLGLPVSSLGKEYLVMSYTTNSSHQRESSSLVTIVATVDNTSVTIAPPDGDSYTVSLNTGQVYQSASDTDQTGTIITANQPVAVFSGNRATQVPPEYQAADHLVEQIPPTSAWGQSFVSVPLATREKGDTFRFLASTDDTDISINGSVVATLDRGEFHEQIVEEAAEMTASAPILVAQYSNSTEYDDVTSDPFMMLLPPHEQFLAAYTVGTPPSGFSGHYINVVAPTAAVGSIMLDGSAIPADEFSAIGATGYAGAQVRVSAGTHNLSGPLPFGVFSYGFGDDDSYGYPGGLSTSPVALVSSLAVSPKSTGATTGHEVCVTAEVNDQDSNPLAGIRVDFTVAGANSDAGFGTTEAQGGASLCYTGTISGTDTLTATVGSLSDTATITYTKLPDDDNDGVPTVDEDLNGDGDPTNDDTDGDGTPDYLDPDDDGDSVPTASEDPNDDGNPTNDDTDSDGIPDYLDTDDDGDSVPTSSEDPDGNGNPTNDDTDSDDTPNYLDPDDDGDSVPTASEDADGDGDPTNDDTDGDGIPDYLDNDNDADPLPSGAAIYIPMVKHTPLLVLPRPNEVSVDAEPCQFAPAQTDICTKIR